jgi:hypothetical protein
MLNCNQERRYSGNVLPVCRKKEKGNEMEKRDDRGDLE